MIGPKKDKDPENCPLIKDLNFPKAPTFLRVRPAPSARTFQYNFCFTLYLLPPLLNPFLTNQARTRDSSPHCWPWGPVLRAPWEAGDHLQGLLGPLLLLHESKVIRTPSTGIISPERGSVGARGWCGARHTQHGGQAWHTGQIPTLCPVAPRGAGSGHPPSSEVVQDLSLPGLHISQSNSHLPSVGRPILLDAFVLQQCVVAETSIRAIVFTLWNIGSDTHSFLVAKSESVTQ